MCGCGPMSSPLFSVTSAGPMWSAKHQAPDRAPAPAGQRATDADPPDHLLAAVADLHTGRAGVSGVGDGGGRVDLAHEAAHHSTWCPYISPSGSAIARCGRRRGRGSRPRRRCGRRARRRPGRAARPAAATARGPPRSPGGAARRAPRRRGRRRGRGSRRTPAGCRGRCRRRSASSRGSPGSRSSRSAGTRARPGRSGSVRSTSLLIRAVWCRPRAEDAGRWSTGRRCWSRRRARATSRAGRSRFVVSDGVSVIGLSSGGRC